MKNNPLPDDDRSGPHAVVLVMVFAVTMLAGAAIVTLAWLGLIVLMHIISGVQP